MQGKILIVDDEQDICWMLSNLLNYEGYKTVVANNGKSACLQARSASPDLVLLDLKLPDMSGIEVLQEVKETDGSTPVIMMTAFGDISIAVEAMKIGATDFITKPFDNDALLESIKKILPSKVMEAEVNESAAAHLVSDNNKRLIGNSPQIQNVMEQIRIVAPTEMTVLIQGESGTGKDLVAHLIHANSSRAGKELVTLDCGSLPETLLESEMFGHEKGAFTGADRRKEGIFEVANGGTIFLNEIGNLTESAQKRFLRVLESKQLQRLGGKSSISVDVRIIAATNLPLKGAVRDNAFRQDLYYRLNQFPMHMPSLRERREDILPIARYFLKDINRELGKDVKGFLPEAERAVSGYSWPGNVRELKNVINRAALMAKEIIGLKDLALELETGGAEAAAAFPSCIRNGQVRIDSRKAKENLEIDMIKQALAEANGNKKKAADILGITRSALYYKMDRLGIKSSFVA